MLKISYFLPLFSKNQNLACKDPNFDDKAQQLVKEDFKTKPYLKVPTSFKINSNRFLFNILNQKGCENKNNSTSHFLPTTDKCLYMLTLPRGDCQKLKDQIFYPLLLVPSIRVLL